MVQNLPEVAIDQRDEHIIVVFLADYVVGAGKNVQFGVGKVVAAHETDHFVFVLVADSDVLKVLLGLGLEDGFDFLEDLVGDVWVRFQKRDVFVGGGR